MPEHLTRYLQNKASTIAKKRMRPIILKWLESPDMIPQLELMDKHVAYLQSQRGGAEKLKQWFLSDDKDFNNITAERYIIWYLRQKNPTIRDHLNTKGVDAYLDTPDGRIGIEVTTLTAFFAEWVFMERLAEFCWQDKRLRGQGFEIRSSYEYVQIQAQGGTIYDYTKKVGHAIATHDEAALAKLHIEVEYCNEQPGYFSWRTTDADTYSWFEPLTSELTQKLQNKQKAQELSNCERNLVFVGVNHAAPTNYSVNEIFTNILRSSNLRA